MPRGADGRTRDGEDGEERRGEGIRMVRDGERGGRKREGMGRRDRKEGNRRGMEGGYGANIGRKCMRM